MQWVFEHIQVIIAVAAAIAYALNRGKGEAEEPPHAPGDAEDAERARQIRDEIRRKIAERREGGVPTAGPEPAQGTGEAPPLLRRTEVPPIDTFGGPVRPVPTEVRAPVPAPTMSANAMSAVLERQNQLAEQMRELERTRELQKRRAAEAAATAAATEAATHSARGSLLGELRGAQNLRRAVVLREVLGPPVALR